MIGFKALVAMLAVAMAQGSTALGPNDFIISSVPQKPDFWVPTAAQAATAKAALLAYLAVPHPPSARAGEESVRVDLNGRIAHSYLQYSGVRMRRGPNRWTYDPTGDPVIVISGLCKVADQDLTHLRNGKPIYIADGGPCYFGATYDPIDDRIVAIGANSYR